MQRHDRLIEPRLSKLFIDTLQGTRQALQHNQQKSAVLINTLQEKNHDRLAQATFIRHCRRPLSNSIAGHAARRWI